MPAMSRRQFLVCSGVTAGAALATGATVTSWRQLFAAAQRDPLPAGASVLVLVTLYGGNDGLNTVVPAADPAYHDARPDLAYAEQDVLPLGDGLGLNPAMPGLAGEWAGGRLAIVRGVSYPQPDHSHFRSMAIWQTASPRTPTTSGWVGRWLDATGGGPLRAVAVGATLPPLLAGDSSAGAVLPLDGSALLDESWQDPLLALSSAHQGAHPFLQRAAQSLGELVAVDRSLATVAHPATSDPDADPGDPTGGDAGADGATAGGQSQLARQLGVVARCIAARVPTRVYSVSLGGFDTHSNERTTQTQILGELDAALTAFRDALAAVPAAPDVVTAVYSEFGRRVAANANQGTDHGTSGPVFVLGDAVNGGFHGDQPSLTALDDGDLHVTTDFRDVYASLLSGVLGADPARILGGYTGELALL